jgi:predicted acylesterase/phospholipase RssA
MAVLTANTLGLALSGGGSRAAAFHCGTLTALHELGLLPGLDVVSTVSGGSVFAAAWMASVLAGSSTEQFVAQMRKELRSGFVLRSLGWRVFLLLLPGYTRSDLIANTFDRVLCGRRTLEELPERPALCLNTSVLNHGQVGKFSRHGFSTRDLGGERDEHGSNIPVPLPHFKLARAVAASAAFPIGLPPILLRKRELGEAPRTGLLAGEDAITLCDGGVLENLGVQTLLKSHRFGAWDLIISDAGQRDVTWRPHSFGRWLAAFAIAAVSASVLRRVLELMNDKENRSMRSATIAEVERSWLLERIDSSTPQTLASTIRDLRGMDPATPRRRLIFVRLSQTWESLLAGISTHRLRELAREKDPTSSVEPPAGRAVDVQEFLKHHTRVGLAPALEMYRDLGGDRRAEHLNAVETGFTGLGENDIAGLVGHARWQVHVLHALYWVPRDDKMPICSISEARGIELP